MPRPGKGERTPGSGRKPGTTNKRIPVFEICQKLGFDPFLELAKIASGENRLQAARQFDALKEICQYISPKLKAIEHSGEVNQRLIDEAQTLQNLPREELLKVIKEELKK